MELLTDLSIESLAVTYNQIDVPGESLVVELNLRNGEDHLSSIGMR
ncbi:hypothetical protein [Arthrobacter pityocampae]